MNTYVWLVRREFWENRAIWVAPLAIGAALTLAALSGRVDLGDVASPQGSRTVSATMLFMFGAVFFAAMNAYATWYLLDCLYADRKDRSILFWKSLPISDTSTVLAKLFTGLLAIPLVYFVAADVATLLVAFIVSVRTRGTFGSALWEADLWLQLQALWLYLIISTAIWYLPFAAYLLVISAWAKRAVVLWSLLPPLASYVAERWFSEPTWWARYLRTAPWAMYRTPSSTPAHDSAVSTGAVSVWHLLDPLGFVFSPATWIGVIVGILFIIAAIQLRMRRTEI